MIKWTSTNFSVQFIFLFPVWFSNFVESSIHYKSKKKEEEKKTGNERQKIIIKLFNIDGNIVWNKKKKEKLQFYCGYEKKQGERIMVE